MASQPPFTRVREAVDNVHGVEIADSYRWLEDTASAEVQEWVRAQRAYTRSVLDEYPTRPALE
ncbi:MAG: hypothetical protein M3Z98_08905, partial [Candidatus Dormibacteraeota bacterium]|nr:hypothetical protein [Candidatus Dormibacteraeota bacterium]